MGKIVDVKIGQTLPPDRWFMAAENLEVVFPRIAEYLKRLNRDGRGNEDANDFMDDAMLALIALRFVGNCVSEQCRFIAIPDKNERK